MSVGVSLEELLVWNQESSDFWKAHLEGNAHLLDLPCDVGGTASVQEFVRHIWGVELRWSQRLAGLPMMSKEETPQGPLDVLYGLHMTAIEIFRGLLPAEEESWGQAYVLDLPGIPAEARTMSRRKVAAHALFHSQRHWAQLATLMRKAGYPTGFKGDLLFSQALD